jgi:hypothetical protein
MNRYEPFAFRPVFGIAAAAMSAVTLAVLVVLPVTLASACPSDFTIADARDPIEVTIIPSTLSVVAAPTHVVRLEPVQVVARREAQAS